MLWKNKIVFWFVLSFEQLNFAINVKYSKKHYVNQNYYVTFKWPFKHTKMQFKKMFIHLGGSFDYVFTLWYNND